MEYGNHNSADDDSSRNITQETHFVPPEFLACDELADLIIEDQGEWRTDGESGIKYREVRWDSDLIYCSLFEIHAKDGIYYKLEVYELGRAGDRTYIFTGDNFVNFRHSYNLNLDPTAISNDEDRAQQLKKYLRLGYETTRQRDDDEGYIADQFAEMTEIFTAEKAYSLNENEMLGFGNRLAEVFSSDSNIRDRGAKALYTFLKTTGSLYSENPPTVDHFGIALVNKQREQKNKSGPHEYNQ